jgi:peroxiredoxin
MLVALAASNVLLIRQNLQMRLALERLRPQKAEAGDKVPPFVAPALDGDTVRVEYAGGGRKTLLFFFTQTCPYCRQQFAFWREVLNRAEERRYDVMGLVADSEDKVKLHEYLRAMGCGSESKTPLRVALIPKAVRSSYKLSATPVTLLVSGDGTVERAWTGLWTNTELDDAGAALGFNRSAR